MFRKAVAALGFAIFAAILCAGFVAHFVTEQDPVTNKMYDGFDRALSDAPLIVRSLLGQERQWAGWLWMLGDVTIFAAGS